jgi:hypothetical protein
MGEGGGVIIIVLCMCVGFGLAIRPAIEHDRNLK